MGKRSRLIARRLLSNRTWRFSTATWATPISGTRSTKRLSPHSVRRWRSIRKSSSTGARVPGRSFRTAPCTTAADSTSCSPNPLRMLCAIAMLGVLPGPASAQTAPAGTPPTSPSQGSFLVFPFENTGGGPRLDWLSEGLEELTIERLSAAGKPVFTHEARTSELERYGLPSSAKFSRATMLHVAGELDADFVIFGSYTFDGNILSVQAHLLRVSPAALFPPVRETGLLETLMDLHTRLVWRLFSANDRNFAMGLADFSRAQRPLRLDAFEHFVRGRLATQEEARTRELR